MKDSFRLYRVIETDGMTAKELQKTLTDATDNEMQIDHVVGTKIILGFESLLNLEGRTRAKMNRIANSKPNSIF